MSHDWPLAAQQVRPYSGKSSWQIPPQQSLGWSQDDSRLFGLQGGGAGTHCVVVATTLVVWTGHGQRIVELLASSDGIGE